MNILCKMPPFLFVVLLAFTTSTIGSPLGEISVSESIRTTDNSLQDEVVEVTTAAGVDAVQRADELTTISSEGQEGRAEDLTTNSPVVVGEERSENEVTTTRLLARSDFLDDEVEVHEEVTTVADFVERQRDAATELPPAVTARGEEEIQWIVSDSATEPISDNEIGGDDEFLPMRRFNSRRRFARELDEENFKYPTTPHPDNITDFTTIIPSEVDIPPERISTNRVLIGRKACRCGTFQTKIVGGEDTDINKYPWTVALVRKSNKTKKGAYCGGTLINNRYIATASHCVDGAVPHKIEVWLNHQNFQSEDLNTTTMRNVEKITMHPNYNPKTIDYDIALLKLDEPVEIGEGVGLLVPACIPADNSNLYEDEDSTVCGWGATSQGGPVSATLKCVTVPIISNKDCNWKSLYLGKITENMVCAGDLTSGGKDSCQGDSGGPLVVEAESQKTLVGIVSFGYGCARPFAPGVYARVGQFSSWIYENTEDAEYCSEGVAKGSTTS